LTVLTLTTDFSTQDGNVGVMKGVIWGIAPGVQIADLTHQVAPQNIRQAAFILARQVFYFPPGTVHVVVVDPGVGTARRPIAAKIGSHFFVGPDNGVFSPLYLRGEKEGWPIKIVHTNRPEFWREEISHVFHGRDIFSPVGAHLASGVELSDLGDPIQDPVRIAWVKPQRQENSLVGEVVHIDHFGNLFISITAENLAGLEVIAVQLGDYRISGMSKTFGEKAPGELIALFSSTHDLLIAQVNGHAAKAIQAKVGDNVEVLVRIKE